MSQVGYVAYIDESGDDGIARVRPIDSDGASEWFVLSALVVRTGGQRETVWVRDILAKLRLHQRRHLHFQPLNHERRLIVCRSIAELPLRGFIVVSNKRNMRGYHNPRAAKVWNPGPRTWFYWWMTRLLLERVTDFCARRAQRDFGEPRLVRFEFARRSGLSYAHFSSYLFWLRQQSRANALYIDCGDLNWSVVDLMNQVFAYDPMDRAGLQLADTIASAFYQSVSENAQGQTEPAYARELEPRMARNAYGSVYGYGVKLIPTAYLWRAPLQQRAILDFYRALKK